MLRRLPFLLIVAAVAGCATHGGWNAPGTVETDEIDEIEGVDGVDGVDGVASDTRTVISNNALSANALSANALSANALSANALSANALSANALLATREGVSFTRYLVRCALAAGDSLTVEADGVEYRFDGLLGLSREWLHAAMNRHSQEWVSACLLAHVNAFELSVPISLRGRGGAAADVLAATPAEAGQFPVYEATFFGNLFDESGGMYACWGTEPDLALAEAWERSLRVCSDPIDDDGTTGCGFIALGMCSDACQSVHGASGAWSRCSAPDGTTYLSSLGVWLRH